MTLDKLIRLFECEFPPLSMSSPCSQFSQSDKYHQERWTAASLSHRDSDSVCLDQPVQQHVVWASHVVANVLAATFF